MYIKSVHPSHYISRSTLHQSPRTKSDTYSAPRTMYAEGRNKRLNYYVPVQQDEPPACKKERCDWNPPRAAHILGRTYGLTVTSYKYLSIGISVGAVSCVELILRDNRSRQMMLPIAIWRELIDKRANIEQHLQSGETTTSSLWIRDLRFEILKLRDEIIVKLTLFDISMYLKPKTMLFLLDLEYCIDHMYSWLCENTHLVNAKFKEFVTLLQENNVTDFDEAVKTIRGSKVFNCGSLIDCELLAYAVDNILYDVYTK